jgi:hypothetical protein
MIMYRHAALRLPCERCAVEQPTRAMILSPSGAGYLCWPCQLRAQIAEHQPPRHGFSWVEVLISVLAVCGVLFGVLRAVARVAALVYLR